MCSFRRPFACYPLALICLLTLGCTISSSPGTLTPVSLSIQPSSPTLPLGLTQTFLAIVQLHNGTSQDVSSLSRWTSSNTAVATIDKKGDLTTVSQGNTTITAAYGSLTATTSVTVTPPGVIAVDINPANPNPIQTGDTLPFNATGTMSDGSAPPDITSKVTWSSSNAGAVSIISGGSHAGLATANAVGVTIISATYGSGKNAPAGFVTLVVNPLLQSVTVVPAAATIAKSTTQQFTAIGLYSDGSTQDLTNQASTQWTCSPGGIATSMTKGLAKAGTTQGTCSVTATVTLSNGSTVVNSPPSTLTVGPQTISTLVVTPANPKEPIGVPVQFSATAEFSDLSVQDVTSAPGTSWSSSTTSVAGKPAAGLTTTLSAGTTTISAKFVSTNATAAPTLTVSSAKLSSITLTTPLTKLGEGTIMQLKATGKFSDGTTQDLTNAVTWKSSGSVLAVSNSGLVTANFPGSATVTATLDGVSATTPNLQVNAVTIKSVTITPASASIASGTTQKFKATATFNDNSQQDITDLVQWNSSDASTATIQDFGANAGFATALASGNTNISAVFGSVNASTSTLTVNGVAPTLLTITPANPSLALGTSQQLKATVTFSDGSTQDVTSLVTWTSDTITAVVVTSSGSAVTVGNNGGAGASATVKATFTPPGGPAKQGSTTVSVH
ncbi:MAG TPA: Ig-like domain-containing protein [Terriglobales bacterium]|nr:Ig-like domain-containing protein [Terriglobales bacterium]